MTKKGYAALCAVAENHSSVIDAVVSAQDGALTDDHYTAIKSLCADVGWTFIDRREQPSIATPYTIAVSWRWMLELPASRVIVLHDSLLPKYRGFAPLVSALINGDSHVGVTAFFATGDYDRGPVIDQVVQGVTYPIRIGELIEQISAAYIQLSLSIVTRLSRGEQLPEQPQDESMATYSLWRDAKDYQIDWSQPASGIRRFIDAVGSPYAGAFSVVDGTPSRILEVEEEDDVGIVNRTPGKVLLIRDGEPIVVCGAGLLRVKTMVEDKTERSMLPLTRLRTRFS
jgi:methionyl-tRNA formyltransferase